jgi:hypothetical protein
MPILSIAFTNSSIFSAEYRWSHYVNLGYFQIGINNDNDCFYIFRNGILNCSRYTIGDYDYTSSFSNNFTNLPLLLYPHNLTYNDSISFDKNYLIKSEKSGNGEYGDYIYDLIMRCENLKAFQ